MRCLKDSLPVCCVSVAMVTCGDNSTGGSLKGQGPFESTSCRGGIGANWQMGSLWSAHTPTHERRGKEGEGGKLTELNSTLCVFEWCVGKGASAALHTARS